MKPKFKLWNIPQQIFYDDAFSVAMDGTAWYDDNGHEHQLKEGIFVLCQFTGMKDKNGKEIYEGDILKKEKTQSTPYIGEVFYASVRCAFAVRHDVHTPHPRYDDLVKCKWSESDGFFVIDPEGDRDAVKEVIGNIYETPELLRAVAKGVSDGFKDCALGHNVRCKCEGECDY